MSAKEFLLTGIVAGAMCPLVQSASVEEVEPACGMEAVPEPPAHAEMACRDKQEPQLHDHRKNEITPGPTVPGPSTNVRASMLPLMGVG